MSNLYIRRVGNNDENGWLKLILMSTGKQEQVDQFLKELESNPLSLSALNHLAQHFATNGDYTKAIQHYEKLTTIQEENGKVWVALGHCYLLKGEYQKCFGAY